MEKNIILKEDTVLVKTNFISKASDVDVQASCKFKKLKIL